MGVNRAKGIFLDAFLTIRASVSPGDLANIGDDRRALARSLLCAYWLSPERGEKVTACPYLIDPDERQNRFREHLSGCGLSNPEIDEWVVDAKTAVECALGEGTAIIDRRQGWLDFAQECKIGTDSLEPLEDMLGGMLKAVEPHGTQLASSIISILFAPGESEDDETDASLVQNSLNAPARDWVSNRYGAGKGTDWAGVAKKEDALTSVVIKAGANIAGLFASMAGALEPVSSGGDPIKIVLESRKKPGRKDKLTLRLERMAESCKLDPSASISDDDADKLSKLLGDVEGTRLKIGKKGTRPWSEAIRLRIEKANFIGNWRDIGVDGQCEIVVGAAAAVIPQTTNIRKRVDELLKLDDDIKVGRDELADGPLKTLEEYERERAEESGGPYRIRRKATRNSADVISEWKGLATAEDRLVAVSELQADSAITGRAFGDHALFKWIAGHVDDLGGLDGLGKLLGNYAELVDKEERQQRLKLPAICHPDPAQHPLWVRFGTNVWPAKWNVQGVPGRVTFNKVWDGASLRRVTGRMVSARMRKDRGDYPGRPRAARRDRLGRLAVGGSDVASVAAKQDWTSAQLYCERGSDPGRDSLPRWHVSLSLRLKPAGPAITWREKKGLIPVRNLKGRWPKEDDLAPGWRVLGIDLGIRAEASYAVLHVCDENEVVAVCKKDSQPQPDAGTISVEIGGPDGSSCVYRRIEGTDLWARRDGSSSGNVVVGQRSYHPSLSEKLLAQRVAGCVGEDYRPQTTQKELAHQVLKNFKRWMLLHGFLARVAASLGSHDDALPIKRLYDRWKRIAEENQTHRVSGLWNESCSGVAVDANGNVTDIRMWLAAMEKNRTGLADKAATLWTEEDEILRSVWRGVRTMVIGGLLAESPARRLGFDGPVQFRGVRWLSPLDRLNLLYDLYRNSARVFARPTPDGPRGTELPDGFGAEILELRKAIRDDCSKQIASAIVRTALVNRCHGIAFEDLSKYRTDEKRGHVENRKVSLWGKADTGKYLNELCELHGLALKSVNPFGTSQESFALKERGVRVHLTPAADLTGKNKFAEQWSKKIETARRAETKAKKDGGELWPLHQAVLDVDSAINSGKPPTPGNDCNVPVPDRGGTHLAFPIDAHPSEWRLEDADQNAAANIALRALTPYAQKTSEGSAPSSKPKNRQAKAQKALRSRLPK